MNRVLEQPLLSVGVECYASHRREQTPRPLSLGDRRMDVVEVVTWELTMFRAEHAGG